MSVAIRPPSARPHLRGILLGVALASSALSGCGEAEDEPPPSVPTDGSTEQPPSESCMPAPLSGWTPIWKPPKAPALNTCTGAQIQKQYALCEDDATYDVAGCRAFQRDPVNAACRSCLFSTEDEASYGAIVILRDRSETANVAGCIAVADGDVTAGGCGAKFQAVSACFDAACMDACASNAAYVQCRKRARDGVCSAYADDTTCANRPAYLSCTQFTTFQEYFTAMANLFCSTGSTGGGTREAGVAWWRSDADVVRAKRGGGRLARGAKPVD